jgi:aminopeptidase N
VASVIATGSGRLFHRSTIVPHLEGVPRGKLIVVNDDDDTYCSLRLDAGSFETALTRTGEFAESMPRALELPRKTNAGSDEQLVYINGLCADRLKERQLSAVLSERHIQVLSALLDTGDPQKLGYRALMRGAIVIGRYSLSVTG